MFAGPMAHLIYGVHEQTHVPFTIAYSLCIGPYTENCRSSGNAKNSTTTKSNSHSSTLFSGQAYLLLIFTFSITFLHTLCPQV